MNARETIIDVTPIEYSSSKGTSGASHAYDGKGTSGTYGPTRVYGSYNTYGTSRPNSTFDHAHSSSRSARYQQPTWKTASSFHSETANPRQVHYGSAYTRFGGQTAAGQSEGPVLGGLVQMAVGAGLVMIGVPMLILPGPGLLSIVGGMALIANGMRKTFGLRLQ